MYFTNFRTGLVEVINVSFEPDIGDWIILNHSSRIGNDVWKHLVMCYTVLYCVYYHHLTWASFIVSSEIKGTRVVLVGDFNAVNHKFLNIDTFHYVESVLNYVPAKTIYQYCYLCNAFHQMGYSLLYFLIALISVKVNFCTNVRML